VNDLDERLRRLDPLPSGWSPEPPDGPRARALLEHILSSPVIDPTEAPRRTPRRSWWWAGAAAAAVAVVAVVGVIVANRDGSDEPTAAPATFQLPGTGGPTMSSCLPVTDFTPDPTSQAFAGTVTATEANTVTLEVDRWYTGDAGQPGVVVLAAGTDVPVALDGVEFVVGERYLVTTLAGEVLICGISAPATPDLEALYAEWYGS
jgi:hypothetical protein